MHPEVLGDGEDEFEDQLDAAAAPEAVSEGMVRNCVSSWVWERGGEGRAYNPQASLAVPKPLARRLDCSLVMRLSARRTRWVIL